MNQDLLKKLIAELIHSNQMLVVIDSGGAISEMYVKDMEEPEFKGQWAMIEAHTWHIHLNLATVDGVQFVENSDNGHDIMPKTYYVRFSSTDGATLIRFYFPNPWLDDDEKPVEFQPEKLKFFEDFRDSYIGQGGIVQVKLPEQATEWGL